MALYYTKILIFSFQILFEGIIGSGSHGDIAVDDVTISYDNCTTLGHESKDRICTKYHLHILLLLLFDLASHLSLSLTL